MAEAFIPNPNNFPQVNHKDRNKANNRVTNLEWVTHSMNMKHVVKTGRKQNKRAVRQYDLQYKFIKEFDSIAEAGKAVYCSAQNISGCASGRTNTAGGYIWRYADKLLKIEIEELRKMCKENDILMKELESYKNYIILSDGRVYSKFSKKFLTLTECNGYYRIQLWKDNIPKTVRVHILVATHFCQNPENKRYVNHKDGNKLNNDYTNLEWVTASENTKHSHSLGLDKRVRRVKQYTLESKYLRTFNNCREAAEFLKIKNVKTATCYISGACRGIHNSAYGYKWKYGKILYDHLQQI